MNPVYLYILAGTLAIPLLRSFEPQVNYISNWKSLFKAISITGAFFIIWDVIFTHFGVWGFNERYLVGFNVINLPIEEWLFFIIIPYSSIFIYDCLNFFIQKDILGRFGQTIAGGLGILLLITAGIFHSQLYTFWNFLLAGLFLVFQAFYLKSSYLGRFFVAYLVHLLPFFIVNGFLTGSYLDEPIVWYNNVENLSVRIGTIPIEDSIYALLLLLMNITIYEKLRSKEVSPNSHD